MTRQTFYRNLRRIAHLYDWYTDGCIRGNEKGGGMNGLYVCPITAVATAKGNYYPIYDHDVASQNIGLSMKDHKVIVATADQHYDSNTRVRKAMLRALGKGG